MTNETLAQPKPRVTRLAWPPLLWIGALHAGALLAFNPAYFTWQALAVCVFLHWVSGGIGICMTYHRLLTHRSFAVRPRWLEYALTIVGCTASEGGAIHWVADHRRHHAHSDEETDVHSPVHGGFGWAHMFWWMTPDITSVHTPAYHARWAPDLVKDPVHVWLDRYFIVFPLLLGAALYAIGGMPFLVWGFFVRSVLVLHTTWLVNSATHVWGYRSHETRDSSTNLWWVALLTYGEGWHNNHHAFQTSARHGLRWWEVDMTYIAIKAMSWVGLSHAIKLPKIRATAGATGEASLSRARSASKKPRRRRKPKSVVGAAK
ncbi:acyl-CoA desaturase [Tautonia plasticadhaerens]|uniref:Fatty acid desaturase n=1 Tax=Tautonia plasticadhaerens TaxID=2527974 RepID=A0A518GYD9_9BACT|nr:fatty acid desaturase [Tautonia plasticadhaerens]QDV33597.1 Fatty acid desaturase [Tautonia plasticadhaerens]